MKFKKRPMTKAISILMTATMLLLVIACAPFTVGAAQSGSYEYEIEGDYASITKYKGTQSSVTIPSSLGGKTVIGIMGSAFKNNLQIQKVLMPNSIMIIDNEAFSGCKNLSEITLSDNMVLVGKDAFYDTAYYNNYANWESGILYIGNVLIKSKAQKTNIEIKDGTQVIADYAFYERQIVNCTFPDTLWTIGNYAFANCRQFNSDLIFSDLNQLYFLGEKAFYATDVRNVVLPDGLTTIGQGVFEGSGVISAKLPADIEYIPENMFYLSRDLESIEIPAKVKYIDNGAFAFTGLKSITIPKSVEYIGPWAFNGSDISKINFPDKFIEVYADAFEQTDYYRNESNWKDGVLYAGSYAIGAEWGINSLNFKSGTKYIAAEICYRYSSLGSVTFAPSVLGIGSKAFLDCDNLDLVVVPPSVNTIGDIAFGVIESGGKYYYKEPFQLICAKGSGAQKYAEEYGINYTTSVSANSISLNRSSLTLGVGEEYTLIPAAKPDYATFGCKWTSSNTSVAAVDGNGTVKTKKAGTATITIKTSNGKTASCKVTVKPAPSSIKVSTSNLTLGVGEEFIISESTNSGSYAWKFNWASSNNSVATVTKTTANKAKIVAKGVGTCNITVKTYNGKTATCKVTVKAAPSSVALSTSNLILGKGETFIIAQNSNSGSYARNFTWSSSNSNVAAIEKTTANKAKITAKGNGTATIKIKTYNGKTATCKVTVKNAPTSVKVNPTSVTLGVGETYVISESTNGGTYANASNLKWSSSNTSVAVVTKGSGNKAVVTAKKPGTATVTIKLYNGKTATCRVTVKAAPSSVKVKPEKISLKLGETYTISESTNSGSYANAANLEWVSSDASVASVKKGSGNKAVVTANGIGTSIVSIKLYNGKTSDCIVTVSDTDDLPIIKSLLADNDTL